MLVLGVLVEPDHMLCEAHMRLMVYTLIWCEKNVIQDLELLG